MSTAHGEAHGEPPDDGAATPRRGQKSGDALALVEPDAALSDALFAALQDSRAAGEEVPTAASRAITAVQSPADVPAYVTRLRAMSQPEGVPDGFVPSDAYWLVRRAPDGSAEVLGMSALRHMLTPSLEDVGGHIGYSIRPTARRQGYGTRILALTLDQARARGLDRVLLTCDTDNVASARVIERNGGILASQGVSAILGTEVSRYWIAL